MKKLGLLMSLLLVITLVFNITTAFADSIDDGILTLEEAKSLALKNNIQYNLQQHYIDQAKEDYQDAIDDSSGTTSGNKNIAAKASEEISEEVAVENAASALRKAVFNKEDMIRTSDYNVTEAYYNVIKAKYSLENAQSDMELKNKALETAKAKYALNIITKAAVSEAETTYISSQISYNEAASNYQISVQKLALSIGQELDASSCKLDMTFSVPDVKSLDLNKVKEGYLQNNTGYFTVREQYKLAQYKLQSTQEKYDDYFDKLKNSTEAVRDSFENMLYDNQKSFEEAEYSYNEKLSDLVTTIQNQHSSLVSLYENYENQKKEFEDEKLAVENNKIKYQMGLISQTVMDSSTAGFNKLRSQLDSTIMNLNLQYLSMMQYTIK